MKATEKLLAVAGKASAYASCAIEDVAIEAGVDVEDLKSLVLCDMVREKLGVPFYFYV